MVWLHRGMCGLDFKTQTNAISVIYTILCAAGIIYGFVIISNPENVASSFFSSTTTEPSLPPKLEDDKTNNNITTVENNSTVSESNSTLLGNDSLILNGTSIPTINLTVPTIESEKEEEVSVAENKETADMIEDGEIFSDETKHYREILKKIQTEGMELIMGSLLTMLLCFLLLIGSKQDKSIYFVPWLTEQVLGLIIGGVVGLTELIGGQVKVSAGFVVLYVITFLLAIFMTYAVMSHFIILRKMKQHSRDIINSVMQGNGYQTGVNYDRLRDELGQARELQEVGPTQRTRADNKRDDLMYFSI